MKPEEFASYDGLGLAQLVRRGEVSPGELLDIAIGQVEARNPELNAVICRLYDQARTAIAAGPRTVRSRRALPAQGHRRPLRGRGDEQRQPALQGQCGGS